MTIFFDLDDTILETAQLKRDIFALLQSLGASELEVITSYQALRKPEVGYTFKKHVQKLYKDRFDADALWKQLEKKLSTLIFSEYASLRDALKVRSHTLYLLTHGEVDFQQDKVATIREQLALDDYLFVPTPYDKAQWLSENFTVPDGSILIDDLQKNRDAFTAIFPNAKAYASLNDATAALL